MPTLPPPTSVTELLERIADVHEIDSDPEIRKVFIEVGLRVAQERGAIPQIQLMKEVLAAYYQPEAGAMTQLEIRESLA